MVDGGGADLFSDCGAHEVISDSAGSGLHEVHTKESPKAMKKGKAKKSKKVEKSKPRGLDPEKEAKLWRYLPVGLLFVLTIILFSGFVFSDQMLLPVELI